MGFCRRNLRWQVADAIVGPHPWPCLYIAFGTRSAWCETVASPKPLGRSWVDGWLEWQEPLDRRDSCQLGFVGQGPMGGFAKRWIPNARNDISIDHHLQRSGGVLRCLWCWYFLTTRFTRCWDHEDPRRPGSLWTQAMKDAVTPKPSFDANDGEFWMCYRDFLKLGSSIVQGLEGLSHPNSIVSWGKIGYSTSSVPEKTKCQWGAYHFTSFPIPSGNLT